VGEVLERDAELGRLRGALDCAATGCGRVVFVGGEAGVGKTTLVELLASKAESAVRVAFGRCDALGTPRALGPFVDIAAGLGVDGADDRDSLLGQLLVAIRPGPPALLVVEDAHWADAATIELLAMLGRRAPGRAESWMVDALCQPASATSTSASPLATKRPLMADHRLLFGRVAAQQPAAGDMSTWSMASGPAGLTGSKAATTNTR
jgi:predicted ATPase